MLDDIGLSGTLEWLVMDYEKRTGIACSFENSLSKDNFTPAFSTAVYRIIQESLTNVARHAQANAVSIKMNTINDELVIQIEDDGVGIAKEAVSTPGSVGILGMTERAYNFGGNLVVSGQRQQGTLVELTMPIRAE